MTVLADTLARVRALAEDGGWKPLAGPASETSAAQAEGHYEVRLLGGPAALPDFGREAEQTLAQAVVVVLYRMLAGDPADEEIAFADAATSLMTALEVGGGWPSGLNFVVATEQSGIERGYDVEDPESMWARVRITLRAVYQAPFGA